MSTDRNPMQPMEKIEPDKTFSHETTPCQKTDFDKTQKTTTTKKTTESLLSLWVGSVSPVVFFMDSFL